MGRIVSEKQCKLCGIKIYNVDVATRYCESCKKIAVNLSHKNGRKVNPYKQRTEENYKLNLNVVANEPFKLTPLYFDKHSEISIKSYTNFFKLSWIDILKKFNRYDELCNYIITEFKRFIKEIDEDKISFNQFKKNHQYITFSLVNKMGLSFDSIKEEYGVKKSRWSNDDLKNNFVELKKTLGRMPLFSEFIELSKINFYIYAERLKLSGKIYDEIIRYYSTNEEYIVYLKNKKDHKSKVGYETGKLAAVYSDEDYEKELKRVFELCLKEYGEMPTRRLFSQLSKIDESAYRGKYNKSWTEICEMFGYSIDKTANRSEKTALETVKSILRENYKPQQTFDWLIGINGYPLFCDGYYPKHNLVIEFDGIQHREPVQIYGGTEKFKILQANDQVKNELIPKNGLKLVRIMSDEPFWDKGYIQNKLNEYNVIQNNAI